MKRRWLIAAVALMGCTEQECQDIIGREPTVTPGDCDSYVPLFEQYGLPVATFKRIAWRESGCNHRSFVIDSDDSGGGLLGINLKAGARTWHQWCGLTLSNVTDAEVNVRCAAAAYQRMGMRPWRT